jgi:hypothetical protein
MDAKAPMGRNMIPSSVVSSRQADRI